MGGQNTTLTQREQRLSDIRVQTSSQGTVLAKGWGRYRVACNLVWYGSFKAIENRSVSRQGGKGGGGVTQETITYTYEAAVILMLGQGPIDGVTSAWKGKERFEGKATTTRRRTLRHTISLPALTAGSTHVVTVPQSADVVGDVAVLRVSQRPTDGLRRIWSRLQRGTQYTRAGGQYTFTHLAPAGDYEITYQVQEAQPGTSALADVGLALASGADDQPIWPWLETNHPAQALRYPGMAYLYASNYQLTNSAQIHNHNFEVTTSTELGTLPGLASPVLDADPATVVADVLIDENWGAGWDPARVSGLGVYSDYCIANGLWLSPVLSEQTSAADALKQILSLTNTNVVWDGETLEFVPLGDEAASAHGRTYTPNTTPVVDLTADHFVPAEGEPSIRVERHKGLPGSSEVISGDDVGYNIWTLEIENRSNGYTTEPVSYEDTAHIAVHGRRAKPTIKAPAVKLPELGARIAAQMCQAELAQRNVYTFSLAWTMGWLRPLQLVTITDEALGLDRKPVRILTIEESGDEFRVTAMEADIGVADAPSYGTQAGEGFQVNFNAPAGDVADPVIFEAPVDLAGSTGLALWVAVTGATPLWGGAQVWASMDDGVTYKLMGETRGGARYGQIMDELPAAANAILDVQLAGRGGQLFSATIEDAQALASLIFVRDGNSGPAEYLAYGSAGLIGPNRYLLADLNRGAYGTQTVAKPAGSQFVRVDDLIIKSEPLDLSMIGKQVRFKFLSYNVFGAALQPMEDVEEYVYTITGQMVSLPPPGMTALTATPKIFGFDLSWSVPSEAPRLKATQVWRATVNDRTQAVLVDEFAYPQSTHSLMGLGAGTTHFFWARLVDRFDNLGPWFPTSATGGVQGQVSSDATQILDYLEDQIEATQLSQALRDQIEEGPIEIQQISNQLASLYTVKTSLTVNGRTYLAGIGVGVENGGDEVESQVLVAANKFAIIDPDAETLTSPFVVVGGQTFINQAFIGEAWITEAQIADAAITQAKIGDLEVSTAKIQQAAVGTLQIAEESVFLSVYSFVPRQDVYDGTCRTADYEVQIASATIGGLPGPGTGIVLFNTRKATTDAKTVTYCDSPGSFNFNSVDSDEIISYAWSTFGPAKFLYLDVRVNGVTRYTVASPYNGQTTVSSARFTRFACSVPLVAGTNNVTVHLRMSQSNYAQRMSVLYFVPPSDMIVFSGKR
jgi:hypothetical protein